MQAVCQMSEECNSLEQKEFGAAQLRLSRVYIVKKIGKIVQRIE
jgi:hypothetical protein